MQRKLQITVYALGGLLVAVMLILANVARRQAPVRAVQAVIDYQGGDTLLSPAELAGEVTAKMPTLVGSKAKEVRKDEVQRVVMQNPYMEACRVSVGVDGDVRVQATQRVPVLHLFYMGREFYLDQAGNAMPPSKVHTADVMVGNGFFNVKVPQSLDSLNVAQMKASRNQRLLQVYTLAQYLHDHSEYGILFDQEYMSEEGDLYLVPKVGDHIVVVGAADDLDRKFHDLVAFYREGMQRVGWDAYEQISLKYRRQVIATRRNGRE